MRDGHGGITDFGFARHQNTHRRTDDITATDDHAVQTRSLDFIPLQHLYNAVRRGGQVRRQAQRHTPYVDGVKAVHVFFRVDGEGHFEFVDVLGQGQLHDEAVHVGVVVQVFDDLQNFGFRCFRPALDERGFKAHLLTGFDFRLHVKLTRGIGTDQHCGEVRRFLSVRLHVCDIAGDFFFNLLGK